MAIIRPEHSHRPQVSCAVAKKAKDTLEVAAEHRLWCQGGGNTRSTRTALGLVGRSPSLPSSRRGKIQKPRRMTTHILPSIPIQHSPRRARRLEMPKRPLWKTWNQKTCRIDQGPRLTFPSMRKDMSSCLRTKMVKFWMCRKARPRDERKESC